MRRYYIAFWDDGHDRGDFTFYSEHRARSKANFEDAHQQAVRNYGYKRAACMSIYHSQLECRDY